MQESAKDGAEAREILAALGIANAAQIEPVTGGQDTLIWRVTRASGTVSALRLFRKEQTGAAERERVALRTAAEWHLPAPVVEAFGTWQDRPVVLLSWCAGQTMGELLADNPRDLAVLGRLFGQMQARIHSVPAPPALGPPDAWIDRLEGTEPELESRLRALPPCPPVLLHLDYHPYNVLMENDQVSGVIDWVDSLAGDPRADIANTIALLRLSPLPPELAGKYDAQKRRLLELAYLRGWQAERGQQAEWRDDMALFLAWAGAVKLADMKSKIGARPGLTMDYLDHIRQWTKYWKEKAGI